MLRRIPAGRHPQSRRSVVNVASSCVASYLPGWTDRGRQSTRQAHRPRELRTDLRCRPLRWSLPSADWATLTALRRKFARELGPPTPKRIQARRRCLAACQSRINRHGSHSGDCSRLPTLLAHSPAAGLLSPAQHSALPVCFPAVAPGSANQAIQTRNSRGSDRHLGSS